MIFYQYRCNSCGELFSDPVCAPKFSGSYIYESDSPHCPYCYSRRISEGVFYEEDEGEENDD